MVFGRDVKEPERMISDDGGLMSLSRLLLLIFFVAGLLLIFVPITTAITVIYPSIPGSELRCFFIAPNGSLITPEKLQPGFHGYLICNLLKSGKFYIYTQTLIIKNDTVKISLPSEDEYRCYNVSINLSQINFLIENFANREIVLPLESYLSEVCIYNYSYGLQAFIAQLFQSSNKLVINQLGSQTRYLEFVIPKLEKSFYKLAFNNIYGKSYISVPILAGLTVRYNSQVIPESIGLSINDSFPVPLEVYRKSNFSDLKEVFLHVPYPITVKISGYKLKISKSGKFIAPLSTLIVNDFIVPIQHKVCEIFVSSTNGIISDCSLSSSYTVKLSEPSYRQYFVAFNVTVDPRFTVLKNVSILVYRNNRLYVSYHYYLIMEKPLTISIMVPFDGTGENSFQIIVQPSNLEPQQIKTKIFVPNPVPQVEASIEVEKSYGKLLLLVWFVLTLVILVILAISEPRFKL
jgi:hypothetical protein